MKICIVIKCTFCKNLSAVSWDAKKFIELERDWNGKFCCGFFFCQNLNLFCVHVCGMIFERKDKSLFENKWFWRRLSEDERLREVKYWIFKFPAWKSFSKFKGLLGFEPTNFHDKEKGKFGIKFRLFETSFIDSKMSFSFSDYKLIKGLNQTPPVSH